FGEPEVAVEASDDARGTACGRRKRELSDRSDRRDAANLARRRLGEPEVAVRPRCDTAWLARNRRERELCEGAVQGNATYIAAEIREPEVAIGARGDAVRLGRRGAGNVELGEGAGRGDLADLAGARFGEPEVAVGSKSYTLRSAKARQTKLCKRT